jgi:LemA protein
MWIAALIILLLPVYAVVAYNRMVRARNMVREAWSGIDVQLKRRYDLIPNLVETVKGYTKHESTVFEEIAQTRAQSMTASTPQDKGPSENALSQQLKSLFAVAESYPDLKASQNFIDLQKSLSEIEDQIQYARRYYNGSVRDFNILIQTFPNNTLAGVFGFKPQEFFEIELATERSAPEVDLGKGGKQ